ncbi:repressor LexA [Candidatus Dojkabacteria bacterium]|nr:repressor LexA [Candidatus Dojkabacteria bacterium]
MYSYDRQSDLNSLEIKMVQPLTKRQKEIFDFIKLSISKNGYAPSLLEIRNHFKLKAVSTVHEHLENLKSKGYIKKEMNQARGIQIQHHEEQENFTKIKIKGSIQNCKLSLKFQEEKTLILDNDLLKSTEQIYACIVKDKSLNDLDINKGDILIISKNTKPKKGDLIVENSKNKLTITKYNGFSKKKIEGHLTSLIRKYIE